MAAKGLAVVFAHDLFLPVTIIEVLVCHYVTCECYSAAFLLKNVGI